jgi:hypothetical protein
MRFGIRLRESPHRPVGEQEGIQRYHHKLLSERDRGSCWKCPCPKKTPKAISLSAGDEISWMLLAASMSQQQRHLPLYTKNARELLEIRLAIIKRAAGHSDAGRYS